jgi:hypothetical protein
MPFFNIVSNKNKNNSETQHGVPSELIENPKKNTKKTFCLKLMFTDQKQKKKG